VTAFLTGLPMQMVALALFSRVVLIVLAVHMQRLIPLKTDMGSPSSLNVWGNFDTWHYVTIAVRGYDRSPEGVNAAFFPVYPMMLNVVQRLFGAHLQMTDYRWVAVLISLAFLLAATYALTVLFLHMAAPRVATLGVVLFLFSPFSYFLNAGYTEPVFIFLAVVTFLLARDKRWWLAAIVVAVGSATRVTGVFLIPSLLLTAWQAGVGWRKLAGIAAVSPLGLVLYMAWQWVELGSPIRFYTVQAHWGTFEDRTGQYIKAFIDSPLAFALNTPEGMTLLTNVAVCLLWIATLWPMYRRFGAAIALFSGLIILQSAFFIVSQGRMLLPAIGVYLTLAAIVDAQPRWPVLKYGLVTAFAMSMTMLGLMFANGQWIV
jgi:hypothetical protein